MNITIYDNINGTICSLSLEMSDNATNNLITISDFVNYYVYDKKDNIVITIKNNDEYFKLDKVINKHKVLMENERPMWFDKMLLIAMINAKYDYLYEGYDFDNYDDDYSFYKFKKSKGLQ